MSTLKMYEFNDFKCRCGCNSNNISPAVVNIMNDMCNELGRFIKVTSAYRCPHHPLSIANPKSAHIGGLACDIVAATSRDRFEIVRFLIANGVNRIGINADKGFIHFDFQKENKAQDVIWIYDC